MCSNPKKLKEERVIHRYKECGLENIVLEGVRVYRCDQCGELYYDFGNVIELHNLIAKTLIQKRGKLTGRELRFLRKRLGYSTEVFADLIQYNPQTLNRIENKEDEIADQLDRSVRFMAALKDPDRDYDLHDMLLEKSGVEIEKSKFKRSKKGTWSFVASF